MADLTQMIMILIACCLAQMIVNWMSAPVCKKNAMCQTGFNLTNIVICLAAIYYIYKASQK
jgi:hypothetical protein